MIIKKIKLHNWKNFQDVEVELTERSFIIGSNASGKSNFLDAFRFLRDIVKQGGGLQTAVEERGGMKKLRCLASRRKSNISIEVSLGEAESDEVSWIYFLDFKHTGGGVMKNEVEVISEKVFSSEKGEWILDRKADSENEDSTTLKHTLLEQAVANREFREVQQFFQSITYLNIIPQYVRESAQYKQMYSEDDYYGRGFLARLSIMDEKKRNAYIRRVNEFLQLSVPQLQGLEYHKDARGIPHLEARYKHWRAAGAKQQEQQFSDGTIRLIGFLFSLIELNGLILLEEPEINLHSKIVAQFPEFIAKVLRKKKKSKQIFITTHSYDLLASSGIDMNEVLVFETTDEGTMIKRLSDIKEVRAVVEAGFSIAEAVIPITAPKEVGKMVHIKLDM